MKKILVIVCIFIILFVSNNSIEDLIIPEESIRVRVIANSNSAEDQLIKKIVRENIEDKITGLLLDTDNISEARNILEENISTINIEVNNILEENNYEVNYNVDYGYNYFPEKKYKGVIYKEGYYESIVITLGSGEGDNWWCVLFPPLCLMETNSDNIDKIEYKSFIKEIIDKYF